MAHLPGVKNKLELSGVGRSGYDLISKRTINCLPTYTQLLRIHNVKYYLEISTLFARNISKYISNQDIILKKHGIYFKN